MNNFNYKYILSVAVILAVICLSLHISDVYAENIIYPGDPNWSLVTMGGGGAVISGENPRKGNTPQSPGNGSLALSINGVNTSNGDYYLGDWAFYSRYADNQSAGWGLLSDINAISFDWYRDSLGGITDKYGAPWLAQTPVLRLLIKDGDTISELVWEKYYTDPNTLNDENKLNTWIEQDVFGDNLWRHFFSDDIGYTISDGTNMPDFGTNTLLGRSVSSWASSASDSGITLPYSSDAVVYGLSVGVGSYWPGKYKGYVDNVLLSFNGTDGSTKVAINDNFELPVPEPATLLLLCSGLAFLAVRRKRHLKS